jgi:xanthine/CO dehydrogenase XdhC/CoxF family maturation factor
VSLRTLPSQKLENIWSDIASDRALSSRLAQVLAGHGFFGGYYRRFVPSESPLCPCGEHIETREHVLVLCPLHEHARHILREASPNLELAYILGSHNGRAALANFLRKTTAFQKRAARPANVGPRNLALLD